MLIFVECPMSLMLLDAVVIVVVDQVLASESDIFFKLFFFRVSMCVVLPSPPEGGFLEIT